jgi:hypothetical protein
LLRLKKQSVTRFTKLFNLVLFLPTS